MATPTLWGTNFRVNSTLPATQLQQHVASLPNGQMVETWLDYGSSLTTIKMRILNADGSFASVEKVVNVGQTADGNMGFGQNSADYMAITGLKDGGYVVTWSYQYPNSANEDIFYKVFSKTGVAVTGNLTISGNTISGEDDPDVVATPDGGFAIAWDSDSASAGGVWYERFTAAGASLGAPVNHTSEGSYDPAIATTSGGQLVIGYTDSLHPIDDKDGVYGYAETSLGAFRIDSGRDWNGQGSTFNTRADIAVLASGDVAAVYWDYGTSTNQVDRVFLSINGNTAVQVNTSAIKGNVDASIVALPDGGFVVIWNDGGSQAIGGTDNDVVAQLYHADGSKNGGELVLTKPALTNNSLNTVEAVSLGDGRVLVSWEAGGPQINGPDIFAQIIDTRTAAITVSGTAQNDQYAGTRFNDTVNGGSGSESIYGYNGSDFLYGNAGNDRIFGGKGSDTITGNAGNDTISGGDGLDKLNGGAGADRFEFATLASAGDTIANFDNADVLVFDHLAFKGTAKGALHAAEFWSNATGLAHDVSDRYIYSTKDHTLHFDSNGSLAGGIKVLIATFDHGIVIQYNDLLTV
jgi:Ca2+-binding RTX toxin-like protein